MPMAGGAPSSGPNFSAPGYTTAMTCGVSRWASLPFSAKAGEAKTSATKAIKTPRTQSKEHLKRISLRAPPYPEIGNSASPEREGPPPAIALAHRIGQGAAGGIGFDIGDHFVPHAGTGLDRARAQMGK